MFTAGNSAVTQRVLLAQLALMPAVALVAALLVDGAAAVSALYGAGIALASTALLAWREAQSRRHPEWDQHRLMKLFIRVSLERLMLLVAMLAIGFGLLALPALPLLLGLAGGQLGWAALATVRKR